jgi:ABC-type amino acid transport substrate-binding protein
MGVLLVVALLTAGCVQCLYAAGAQAPPLRLAAVRGSADVNVGAAVVTEAYRRLGIGIEIVFTDGQEALALSNSGQMDGEIQRIDGIERRYPNLVQIPVPVNFIQGVAFARADTLVVRSWHSLRPFRIGIVRGIVFAEEGTRGMDARGFPTYDALIEGLERGDVDIAVMPQVNGRASARKLGAQGIIELEGVLEQMFLYHYLHKRHRARLPAISSILKGMLEDGTTRRIRNELVGHF